MSWIRNQLVWGSKGMKGRIDGLDLEDTLNDTYVYFQVLSLTQNKAVLPPGDKVLCHKCAPQYRLTSPLTLITNPALSDVLLFPMAYIYTNNMIP